MAYVRFAVEQPGHFRTLTRAEIIAPSPRLQPVSPALEQSLDVVLGRHHAGNASRRIALRSAGMPAGQALIYGLARMITDGLLGDISADQAERLAYEITGVRGVGLGFEQ